MVYKVSLVCPFHKHIGDYMMIKKHRLIMFVILVALLVITCKSNYTQKTEQVVHVKSIFLSPTQSTVSLINGTTYQLQAQVKPENATNKQLGYASDKAEIASVDNKGLIKAHKVGNANITITAADGISKIVKVIVTEAYTPVEDIFLSPDQSPISIVNGTTYQLQAQVKPENATNKQLSYVSDKADIASVDNKGLIKAHKVGTANITITAADGISKTIKVIVTAAHIPVISIEFIKQLPEEPIELFIGDEYKLEAKAMPENATNKKLNFDTSDSSIARLSGEENNVVNANGEGEAKITITSDDNPSIIKEVRFKMKKRLIPSIRIKTPTLDSESNGGELTFIVETLNGKLEYTPEVVGGGAKWVNTVTKTSTSETEDLVRLNVVKNKTVWNRIAYIKFKDNNTNKYIKTSDNKHLEVKLTQKKNENPNVTIKWVYGITPPTDSEKQKVEIQGSNPTTYCEIPHVFYWYETEHTKFFNTRKMNPTGSPAGGNHDSNQCWAKTSSNMLHWWFEQNKENVEKYIAKKGITKEGKPELYEMYNPYYTRGLPDKDENIKSSIANEFRTKCGNSPQGSYIRNGLKWYLFGLQGFAKKPNYSPELFKDIFDVEEENNPIYVKGIYTKKEFEDVLKEALAPNSKKAIGINLHGDATYGHAITLWGAAFDEEENVIAIYVCDNNFKPNRIFTYGIYYQQDIYTDYKNDVQVLPYLINYSINFYDKKKHVGEITTLDKGDAQWKKWFDANQ